MLHDNNALLPPKAPPPSPRDGSGRSYVTEYFRAVNFQFRDNIFTYDVVRTGKQKQDGRNVGHLDKKIIYQGVRNLNAMDKSRYVREVLPLEPYLACQDYGYICRLLGVPIPKWLRILDNYNVDCRLLQQAFDDVEEANAAHEARWMQEQKSLKLRKTTYHEASNLGTVFLLAPFTLGLSFLFLVTERKGRRNAKRNAENRAWNDQKIAEYRSKFDQKSDRQLTRVLTKWNREFETFTEKYRGFTFHRLFLGDRDLKFYDTRVLTEDKDNPELHRLLDNQSGIYIIWNATKQNKYYVGQTNNLYRRLVQEHFSLKSNLSSEDNSGFLNDMQNHCAFRFSFIYCENAQDVKDDLERELISRLKAVEYGYNKSGGNS